MMENMLRSILIATKKKIGRVAKPDQQRTRSSDARVITTGRLVGLVTGPILLAIILITPMPLTTPQHNLLAVVVMTITYWVFRALPIPITSILALALAVVLNVATAEKIFGAFSSPILFLLIGGFIITRAMVKYGLGRRIALFVLSIPGIAGSTNRIIIAFGALGALLSGVIDNGAVAAMLLPIAVGLIHALSSDIREQSSISVDERRRLNFGTALMLMTAYGPTVGALLTPFGDASNLVGWDFIQGHFGISISLTTWMAMSVPIVIMLFAVLSAAVLLVNRPEVSRLPGAEVLIAKHRRALGPMSRGEINTAIAFTLAILLWLLPPVIGLISGPSSPLHDLFIERLQPAVVAVLAACLLFVLPIGRRKGFTLSWRQDVTNMDWGPVLLMGSSLTLGHLMADTGLAQIMGTELAEKVDGVGAITVYLFAAAVAIMISELTSNLVSISILVPIIPTVAVSGGGDPLQAALIATFAAVYGFTLPISTSANAIVYGSGQVPFMRMVRTGIIVDISGIVMIVVGVLTMLQFVNLN
ncbi:SLC13 family permease [Microbulbifer rhizosphaerae]|uniref:Sodium-dependent dicarboxylate transporter 2/3/5 n=1 Tax=Microbulbifer rhizosphaerae TaxID=1562603 RepID=A0A7W4Z839_9GAMM|nr:DASS family sodium-coupled anion symporter [Microbulbifer rhizosphaerae]MBB3060146.1 sodium-dependent dicarboxylate transporter 2/3/5 [Microbulbifer rhizosphaerae]